MDVNRRWTIRAAAVFALVGVALVLVWEAENIVSYLQTPRELPSFITELFFAAVFSAVIGGFWWELLVERAGWWSAPKRGAIAGLLTGWLSTTALIITMSVLGEVSDLLASSEGALQEFATVVLTSTLISVSYLGPILIFPVGILTGYLLGRRYSIEYG